VTRVWKKIRYDLEKNPVCMAGAISRLRSPIIIILGTVLAYGPQNCPEQSSTLDRISGEKSGISGRKSGKKCSLEKKSGMFGEKSGISGRKSGIDSSIESMMSALHESRHMISYMF
jgi:hypothetical protein